MVSGAEELREDEPYADVPPGFYVREDADYGEVLVPILCECGHRRDQHARATDCSACACDLYRRNGATS